MHVQNTCSKNYLTIVKNIFESVPKKFFLVLSEFKNSTILQTLLRQFEIDSLMQREECEQGFDWHLIEKATHDSV